MQIVETSERERSFNHTGSLSTSQEQMHTDFQCKQEPVDFDDVSDEPHGFNSGTYNLTENKFPERPSSSGESNCHRKATSTTREYPRPTSTAELQSFKRPSLGDLPSVKKRRIESESSTSDIIDIVMKLEDKWSQRQIEMEEKFMKMQMEFQERMFKMNMDREDQRRREDREFQMQLMKMQMEFFTGAKMMFTKGSSTNNSMTSDNLT